MLVTKKLDENKNLKDRIVCKSCYNKMRRKNNTNNTLIQNQQTKIDNSNTIDNNHTFSACEIHCQELIGPSNNGKIFYMLKVLQKIDNKQPIQILTRPPNQYPSFKKVLKLSL